MYDMSTPVVVAYYGQTKAFTYNEIQNGVFEGWLNQVYTQFQSLPCQTVITTVTNTSTTNITTNIVNTVLNLNSITSLSSIGGLGINVGSNVNSGSNTNNNGENGTTPNQQSNTNNNSGTQTQPSQPSTGSGAGTTPPPQGGNSTGSNQPTTGGNSSSQQPVNNDKSNSGNTSGEGNSGGGENNSTPSDEKVETQKTETQKQTSTTSSKQASKAKTETQKPAILVTGDIVGLQTKADGSQDARGTFSFTRVKGDGTASLGLSADYMVNARIGNFTAMKSWISTNAKGNKGINLLSSGFSFMPGSISNTTMFIRINSLKKLTLIYGAAGVYGKLFDEEMITTLAITGFMYKGKLTKKLDVTIITAAVYSPYTKYYTESLFKANPIVVPFFNFNYKLTKSFGFGITGGTTYITNNNVLNYQVLLGAKMIL